MLARAITVTNTKHHERKEGQGGNLAGLQLPGLGVRAYGTACTDAGFAQKYNMPADLHVWVCLILWHMNGMQIRFAICKSHQFAQIGLPSAAHGSLNVHGLTFRTRNCWARNGAPASGDQNNICWIDCIQLQLLLSFAQTDSCQPSRAHAWLVQSAPNTDQGEGRLAPAPPLCLVPEYLFPRVSSAAPSSFRRIGLLEMQVMPALLRDREQSGD